MVSQETKPVIRLIGGPADGFVFSVPAAQVPVFVAFGPAVKYERDPGDGEVICYRFTG